MSIERFEACAKVTMGFEGGFGDNPDDPGGATNLGITFLEWNQWKAAHNEGQSTLHEFATMLTPEDVLPIYLQNYWMPVNDGTLPPPVDMVMFDTAVLEGVSKAKLMWNHYSQFKTLTAKDMAMSMIQWRRNDFNVIVSMHNRLKTFLQGWLNRCDELQDKINAGSI